MRRVYLRLALALLLTLLLTSPALAKPVTSAADCTIEVAIINYSPHLNVGVQEATVCWSLRGSGWNAAGHNHLHWLWISASGERSEYQTVNQPGPADDYTGTLTGIPNADGYIEVWAHASAGWCAATSVHRQIIVGSPPLRTWLTRLPLTASNCGRLFVSQAQSTEANGQATLVTPRGNVRVIVSQQFGGAVLAGMRAVALVQGDRVLVVVNDPDGHYLPQFVERAATGSANPVLSLDVQLGPVLPTQLAYPCGNAQPQLLSGFNRAEKCLTSEQLAALLKPGQAVYVMLAGSGPVIELLGGVQGSDAPAVVRNMWCGLGIAHPANARIWTHPGVPITFVELVSACQPQVPICP